MFIGKIITTSKKNDVLDFIEKTSDININKKIPTLIIGRKNAEEIYGKDKVKVLNKEIEHNVFWTFSKTERRIDYEEDIEKFYSFVIKELKNRVKYEYFNIFTEDKGRICSFIEWLYNGEEKYIYIYENHLYIYYFNKEFMDILGKQTVLGVSLEDIEYIGKEKDKVLDKIYANPNNIIIKDTRFISPNFIQRIKSNILVPYLYFLKNQ